MAEMVEVVYSGSGGTSAEVAPYNEGSARVQGGDDPTTITVPESLANALILSSDWTRTDGVTVAEAYEVSDEERAVEEASAAREPNHVGESPAQGFTANDELAGKSHEKVVAEREAEEAKSVEAEAPADAPTNAVGERVRRHPIVERQQEAAKEQGDNSGQDSSKNGEEE